MSGDSLAKADKPAQPKGWGMLAGTLWATVAFLVPQLLVAPLLPLLEAAVPNENVRVFVIQMLVHVLTFAGLWLIVRGYKLKLRDIGLGRTRLHDIILALVIFPVYLVGSVVLTNVVAHVYPVNLDQEQLLGFASPAAWELALIFVALVLVTPLVEEMVFRGFLFRAYVRRLGFWPAAVLVSLLFAVAHGQLNVALDVFALSIFLCYLRMKTDSLWPSFVLHATKNFVAFYILFIIGVK